jgi:hypothetical protein
MYCGTKFSTTVLDMYTAVLLLSIVLNLNLVLYLWAAPKKSF